MLSKNISISIPEHEEGLSNLIISGLHKSDYSDDLDVCTIKIGDSGDSDDSQDFELTKEDAEAVIQRLQELFGL